MTAHCSPPVDEFSEYCKAMRHLYGKDVPLMSRERWDIACSKPRTARALNEAEFDNNYFSEEVGDGPIY